MKVVFALHISRRAT